MLEFKEYSEIDLDETPIVVLGCGHFFTTETLDGIIGMHNVYETDQDGQFIALKDNSGELSHNIPFCPSCKQQIRQFVTQRYNRVINRAVIDEMSKRFLVHGQTGLARMEEKLEKLENDLEHSKDEITKTIRELGEHVRPGKIAEINRKLSQRNAEGTRIEREVKGFLQSVNDKNQPAQKLYDATVSAIRRQSLPDQIESLKLEQSVPRLSPDRRVTLGGQALHMKTMCIILVDRFAINQVLSSKPTTIKLPGGKPQELCKAFFRAGSSLIVACKDDQLPKLAVESSLYFARVAQLFWVHSQGTKKGFEKATEIMDEAKSLLEDAKQLCLQPFQGADALGTAVQSMAKAIRREWREEVTAEEMASIKAAMVSGRGGIASHSGHW